MPTIAVLAALVSLAAPTDSARITGVVSSTYNGRPLVDVLIAVPGAQRFTVSDSLGAFELAGLPAGRQLIRIMYRGRTSVEHIVELKARKTKRLSVLLDIEAVDLAPVVVTAEREVDLWGLAGFYRRRTIGFGRFFTPEDIAQRKPERLSDLLRGTGAFWGCVGNGCGPLTFARGRRCAMGVRIDGMPAWGEELDAIEPADVGGVEIYSYSYSVPVEFGGGPLTYGEQRAVQLTGRGFLTLPQQMGLSSCGTVLVWTRDFRSRWEL